MTRISRFYIGTWISYPLHNETIIIVGEYRLVGLATEIILRCGTLVWPEDNIL